MSDLSRWKRVGVKWIIAVSILLSVIAWQYHRLRKQQTAAALASINEVSTTGELWRYPQAIDGPCRLIFSTPPDVFKRYAVRLTPEQITDDMVEQLIALDALDSVTVLGQQPSDHAQVSPVTLNQMPIAASDSALSKLHEAYPRLYLYVDPLSEFDEATMQHRAERFKK